MRSDNLIKKGEDCDLISQVSSYHMTPENAKETESKSITLKKMVRDGWKIVYVKDFSTSYSTEFMFILTKDK